MMMVSHGFVVYSTANFSVHESLLKLPAGPKPCPLEVTLLVLPELP